MAAMATTIRTTADADVAHSTAATPTPLGKTIPGRRGAVTNLDFCRDCSILEEVCNMHPARFGTRSEGRSSGPSSAIAPVDMNRAQNLLLKYQLAGEDLFHQAVSPCMPGEYHSSFGEVQPAPWAPAMHGHNYYPAVMSEGLAWADWHCMLNVPAQMNDHPSKVKQVIDNIVELQGLNPFEVEALLKDAAAKQGPYED